MPSPIPIPIEKRCTALKPDGTRCLVARLPTGDRCTFHAPRKPAAHASVTLDAMANLDLTAPESIVTARTGIWQNLLAGTLEPHVAKVALDVAETIHKNARAKPRDTKSTVERMTEAVISKPPPQPDAE